MSVEQTLALAPRQRAMLEAMGIGLDWLPVAPSECHEAPPAIAAPVPTEEPALLIDTMDPAVRSRSLRDLRDAYEANQSGQTASTPTPIATAVAMDTPATDDVRPLALFNAQGQAVNQVAPGGLLVLVQANANLPLDAPPLAVEAWALFGNLHRALQLPEAVAVSLLAVPATGAMSPAAQAALQALDSAAYLILGRQVCAWLLGETAAVGKLRGQSHRYQGRAAIASYPLEYLCRAPQAKLAAWQDWLQAKQQLLPAPAATSEEPASC